MLLLASDSATELWKTEPQDARDQGGNTCILTEEARTPQSTGASRIGLESAEPTALLLRAETLPEPTGKNHLDLGELGEIKFP